MRLLLVFPFLDLRLLLVIALFVALGLFRPLFLRLLCGSGAGVLRVRPDPWPRASAPGVPSREVVI